MQNFALAIHGGAGAAPAGGIPPELEAEYRAGLKAALNIGKEILSRGGSALEASIGAVVNLEDNILFNAGRGSAFSNRGKHEMDACIMDGSTLAVGAVCSVENIKNPIKLASRVMTDCSHVLLCREGAIEFATSHSLETAEDSYFYSPYRYELWQRSLKENVGDIDTSDSQNIKSGTVGAVAFDVHGNLACATSTGGTTNKRFNRIGDTPIVGAGSYANNNSCAISCTGHGEDFIRTVAAYDVSCQMEYKGLSLKEAMNEVLHHKIGRIGGRGGMIGVDKRGNFHLVFNTGIMHRAALSSSGEETVEIF